MGRTEMDILLGQWIFDLVGEDTGRETRDDLLRPLEIGGVQHIVVDQHVVSEECRLEHIH